MTSGVLFLLLLALPAVAQMGDLKTGADKLPPELSNVGIDQKLGAQLPLDATFHDEFGRTVHLGDFFNQGKPIVLTLVYYDCPMLCTEVLNSQSSTMRLLKFDVGKEYDAVTVSFDPRETPELALAKKRAYLQRYGRDGANGWHFLTGDEANIHRLTEAVGFHYAWDAKMQQYAHATAIMVATPQGRLAQYFYGIEYSPKDLRFALVEASNNKLGTVVDRVLLYCYHYDRRTGRYGAVITKVLQVAGAVTVLILGGLILVLFKKGPRRTEQVR